MLPYSIVAIIEINVAIDSRAEMATMASCGDNILRGHNDPNKIGEVENIITDFYNGMTRGRFKCGLETAIIHSLIIVVYRDIDGYSQHPRAAGNKHADAGTLGFLG